MNKRIFLISLLSSTFLHPISELAQDYIELAKSAQQKGTLDKAENYYTKAININTKEIEPHFLLANMHAANGNYAKALDQYLAVLAERDNIPTILYNAAYCLKALGRMKEAREYYEKALKMNPDHGDAHHGFSHALLALGEYDLAWPHFEYRWSIPRKDAKKFIEFMHSGGNLAGKVILLRCEYGLGDSFQFIRYAQLIKEKGARVIVEAQKQLVLLFSLCPYIDQVIPADSVLPPHDFACTLMSLPYAFKTNVRSIPDRIPYIHVDEKLKEEWKTRLAHDTNFKIGICWNGNVYDTKTLQDLVKEKSVPLAMFSELSTIQGVSLYSIQKTSGTDQLKNLPQGFKIISFDTDFDESHGRFMDTAALMESLDLIITIDTSIAHLAGGLGRPTCVMLPYAADWRWMKERMDSPWYPTVKLFRQQDYGVWTSAISSLVKYVQEEVSKRQAPIQSSLSNTQNQVKPAFLPSQRNEQAITDPSALAKKAADLYNQRDLPRALEAFNQLALMVPNNPLVHFNIGKVFQEATQYRQAIEAYKKALELKPDILAAYSGLGTCYLILSEMETAWGYWRAWFARRDNASADAKPLWQGEDLKGKRILIEDEGGFGDIIQWIRYAQLLKEKGGSVILETKASVIPLLSSCKAVDQFVAVGSPRPEYDVRVPFERIHCQANTTMQTIPAKVPYLHAKKELVEQWKSKLATDSKNLKIGICWSAQQFMNAQTGKPFVNHRSIPLEILATLASIENVSLYSLQQVNGLDQLKTLPRDLKVHTFDFDFDQRNGKFMDTAAVMMNLDLIITVDTSIAHLAGALGRHVWVMIPQDCDWRWYINRKDSPWYPTMRLFRQPEPGDWQTVINNVSTALHKELVKRFPNQPALVDSTKQTSQKVEALKPAAVEKQVQEVKVTSTPSIESFQSLFNKGISEYTSGNLDGALQYFQKVQTIAPNEAGILYNLATTYRRLNQMPQAIETFNKLLVINPNHHDALFGLAQAHLGAGNIKEGWQLFNGYRPDVVKLCPTIEQLAGKTVVVRHEWGLGDAMHFIRYTKLLKAAKVSKVIVETPAALVQLLKGCPYIDEIIQHGKQLPKTDYQIPLLYLPTLFNTSRENIPAQVPYLHADSSLIMQWRSLLKNDDKFKIGISWDIGHHDTNFVGWQRSTQLESWIPFSSINGISMYNLQKDGAPQLAKIAGKLNVHDFGPDFDTKHGGFMDTAAIMKNLDLVITVDTSVAHLAGALGVPVWLLLPYSPDYRWTLEGDSTAWYPTMRLFRQTKSGDWNSVMKEVCFELKKLLKQDTSEPQKQELTIPKIQFDPINNSNLVEQLFAIHGKK
jgi:tetratricopeptide (TPR) repeat protein